MARGARPPAAFAQPPRGLSVLGLLALLAAACAGPPPGNTVAPGYAGAASVRDVLLLPPNVTLSLPSELEAAAAPVQEEVQAYLEAHGKSVRSMGLGDARDAWILNARAYLSQAGGAPKRFEDAARVFVRRLRAQQAFDALVLPSIIAREARVEGRSVAWDGVQRQLRWVNPPQQLGSMAIPGRMSGNILVPSLHVAVFSAEGEQIFEGLGGLDLVQEVHFEGETPSDLRWAMLPRPDAFDDRAPLREGIAVAFDPLLPRHAARR